MKVANKADDNPYISKEQVEKKTDLPNHSETGHVSSQSRSLDISGFLVAPYPNQITCDDHHILCHQKTT